jgi:hypothetical protein
MALQWLKVKTAEVNDLSSADVLQAKLDMITDNYITNWSPRHKIGSHFAKNRINSISLFPLQ